MQEHGRRRTSQLPRRHSNAFWNSLASLYPRERSRFEETKTICILRVVFGPSPSPNSARPRRGSDPTFDSEPSVRFLFWIQLESICLLSPAVNELLVREPPGAGRQLRYCQSFQKNRFRAARSEPLSSRVPCDFGIVFAFSIQPFNVSKRSWLEKII